MTIGTMVLGTSAIGTAYAYIEHPFNNKPTYASHNCDLPRTFQEFEEVLDCLGKTKQCDGYNMGTWNSAEGPEASHRQILSLESDGNTYFCDANSHRLIRKAQFVTKTKECPRISAERNGNGISYNPINHFNDYNLFVGNGAYRWACSDQKTDWVATNPVSWSGARPADQLMSAVEIARQNANRMVPGAGDTLLFATTVITSNGSVAGPGTVTTQTTTMTPKGRVYVNSYEQGAPGESFYANLSGGAAPTNAETSIKPVTGWTVDLPQIAAIMSQINLTNYAIGASHNTQFFVRVTTIAGLQSLYPDFVSQFLAGQDAGRSIIVLADAGITGNGERGDGLYQNFAVLAANDGSVISRDLWFTPNGMTLY